LMPGWRPSGLSSISASPMAAVHARKIFIS
jgi:hypothetical protein